MSTQAKLGKGTQIKRGDGGSPEVFTLIPECADVPEAPSNIRDLVEASNHDTVGTDKEFILGLGDGNELACAFNYYGHAQQTGLRTDKEAGTQRNFQIYFSQLTTPETVTFTALVRAWTLETPINGPILLRATLKVSGTPVWS